MRAFAPGKLVLTGAYAVLVGAPAIAVAVSRGALADAARVALTPTPEVQAALGVGEPAPHADASSMFLAARKIGVGASAAILVASLAARDAAAGADLADPAYRAELFARARAAHAAAQSGGSGVDVAASVYGGAIRYVVGAPVTRVALPAGLRVDVFACATSARTSELRAHVDRLAASDPELHRACSDDLVAIAKQAAGAVADGDADRFIAALRRTARGLARLGDAAGIGIVPAGFEALEAAALDEGAAFAVSGAGGGDVAVHVGREAPSPAFHERAHALGLFRLDLSLDEQGVRIAPAAAPAIAASAGAPQTT